MIRIAAVFVVFLCLASCAPARVTTIGPKQPPREPTCRFDVFMTPPAGFREIATIDFPSSGKHYSTVPGLRKHIRGQVCAVGGDAVIAYANGAGVYIKASVLKREPPAPQAPVVQAPAPSALPVQIDDQGCRYDTQCKGDRICVAGECKDPVKQ